MAWSEWEPVNELGFEEMVAERRHRERGGGVLRLSFSRPERLNAATNRAFDEICRAMHWVRDAEDIGVVVFRGRGDHFGVGGDLQWGSGGIREMWKIPPVDDLVSASLKPTLAAVHGYCIGAHNHLAYHCDFTLAADSAVFGQFGPKIGSPIHGELVASLAHVVGIKRAKEMWMLCRQYTAQQMLEWGLVNAVVPAARLDAEVDRWCDELLDVIPECLALVKQSFEGVGVALKGMNDRLLSMIAPRFFDCPNPREAATAFFQKRKPDFWSPRTG